VVAVAVTAAAAVVCGLQKAARHQNGRGPTARGDRVRARAARQIQNRPRPK